MEEGSALPLITDGFYEWKKPEKQPYALAMADKSHMVMAGLWDEWTEKKTGERVKSCTIITCPANALIGTLHDRTPVILAEEDWAKWLGEVPATNDELGRDPSSRLDQLGPLRCLAASDAMRALLRTEDFPRLGTLPCSASRPRLFDKSSLSFLGRHSLLHEYENLFGRSCLVGRLPDC